MLLEFFLPGFRCTPYFEFNFLQFSEQASPVNYSIFIGKGQWDLSQDIVKFIFIPGVEQAIAIIRFDQKTGQAGEQVIKKTGDGRIPDNQNNKMNGPAIGSRKIYSFGRTPDRHRHLAFCVNPGMRHSNTMPQSG